MGSHSAALPRRRARRATHGARPPTKGRTGAPHGPQASPQTGSSPARSTACFEITRRRAFGRRTAPRRASPARAATRRATRLAPASPRPAPPTLQPVEAPAEPRLALATLQPVEPPADPRPPAVGLALGLGMRALRGPCSRVWEPPPRAQALRSQRAGRRRRRSASRPRSATKTDVSRCAGCAPPATSRGTPKASTCRAARASRCGRPSRPCARRSTRRWCRRRGVPCTVCRPRSEASTTGTPVPRTGRDTASDDGAQTWLRTGPR
mmetsp:Transcript_93122/g.272525  ORF Transcript_93122/g.272525 Transcript_93122/m.272525 type:complete len:266 (-) Transcript_93122:192-989(-)